MKKYIPGNTAMPDLATLLTLGFRKCHQLIFRPKIWVCINFWVFTIIFKAISWKNIYLATLQYQIWQHCNAKSGNLVDRWVPKMLMIDFLSKNMGVYQFWGLYRHFLKNKLKKYIYLATLQGQIWQPCWPQGFESVSSQFLVKKYGGIPILGC